MLDDYGSAYTKSGLTDAQIMEEIICDANGGMNIFTGAQEILANKFAPQLEAVKEETKRSQGQPNAPPKTDNRALKLSREIPIRRDFISEEEQKRIRSDRHYLSKQIDSWLKGTMPKGGYFDFGKTSDYLKRLGAADLSVVMNEEDILKFTTDYKDHAVTLEDIKAIPSELADPLIVFKGSKPDSYAIITGLMDKTGEQPVLVALHLDRPHKRIRANRIASIYGKGGIEHYIDVQVKEGNYLGGDKKRSYRWGYELGLQLPSLVQSIPSASKDIVAQNPKKSTGALKTSQEPSYSYHAGDLGKDEDLARKKEIGTACFSEESESLVKLRKENKQLQKDLTV